MSEWISVKDKLPKIGERTKCKAEFWRYNQLHHVEEIEAEYSGFEIVGHPMWRINSGDDAFVVVTHWCELPAPPEGGESDKSLLDFYRNSM